MVMDLDAFHISNCQMMKFHMKHSTGCMLTSSAGSGVDLNLCRICKHKMSVHQVQEFSLMMLRRMLGPVFCHYSTDLKNDNGTELG